MIDIQEAQGLGDAPEGFDAALAGGPGGEGSTGGAGGGSGGGSGSGGDGKALPAWAIVLAVLAAVLMLAGVALLLMLRRRRQQDARKPALRQPVVIKGNAKKRGAPQRKGSVLSAVGVDSGSFNPLSSTTSPLHGGPSGSSSAHRSPHPPGVSPLRIISFGAGGGKIASGGSAEGTPQHTSPFMGPSLVPAALHHRVWLPPLSPSMLNNPAHSKNSGNGSPEDGLTAIGMDEDGEDDGGKKAFALQQPATKNPRFARVSQILHAGGQLSNPMMMMRANGAAGANAGNELSSATRAAGPNLSPSMAVPLNFASGAGARLRPIAKEDDEDDEDEEQEGAAGEGGIYLNKRGRGAGNSASNPSIRDGKQAFGGTKDKRAEGLRSGNGAGIHDAARMRMAFPKLRSTNIESGGGQQNRGPAYGQHLLTTRRAQCDDVEEKGGGSRLTRPALRSTSRPHGGDVDDDDDDDDEDREVEDNTSNDGGSDDDDEDGATGPGTSRAMRMASAKGGSTRRMMAPVRTASGEAGRSGSTARAAVMAGRRAGLLTGGGGARKR